MKFLLGTKGGMTQIFDDNGRVWPVTVVSATPSTITQIKTIKSDGYNAIQIGFSRQKESRVGKALIGHFKKAGQGAFSVVREVRLTEVPTQAVGDTLAVGDIFQAGDAVTVAAVS